MSHPSSGLDRSERLTVVVFIFFCVTLAAVVALDESIGWLLWGVAMVVLTGAVLVLVNRSTPVEE